MKGRTGYTCVRHSLCFVNTFMWFIGCSILLTGIWLRLSYGGYATLLHQYSILSIDSMCLAVGITTFVVSFFGCCGAWFQVRCMIITYFGCIVAVLVLQLLMVVLVFAFRYSVSQVFVEELKEVIRTSYNESVETPITAMWNSIQEQLMCCGVDGYEDWYRVDAWPTKEWVPQSCCLPKYTKQGGLIKHECGRTGQTHQWYNTGCYSSFKMWIVERLHVMGILFLVFAFLQLFGLIASLLLFCTSKNRRRSATYRSYQTE